VRPAAVPHSLRDAVFRGSEAVAAGLLSRRQLDGVAWRRLVQDVYVHAAVPVTHQLRAEAACLLLPDALVTGRSAAVLWGVDLADAEDDVEVTVPPTAGPRRLPGVRVRRAVVPPEHRSRRAGVPVTTPEATAVRLAASLPEDEAVVAVDQMVASGVVDLAPIRAVAAAVRGPGSRRARAVCGLADGLAGSPQETRLRLLIHRSGLPRPVAQFRVMDGDRFVARVDFAWPDRKVIVEYDGLWHAEDGQFARDRRRLNRLRAAGWTVVFVTAEDVRRPAELIASIAAALAK
jgi:G:T-mismatch repair DNA endonuclease (very short patch repair protein)